MRDAHMKQEISRIRQHGTRVTNTSQSRDPGEECIKALRDIAQKRRYAKIDGRTVDFFSASIILELYDSLSVENQAKFRYCAISEMITAAYIGNLKKGKVSYA